MCPFDRAIQVCCHPNYGGRRLMGADGVAPINATLAAPTNPAIKETVEVRVTSKPTASERMCISTCKSA